MLPAPAAGFNGTDRPDAAHQRQWETKRRDDQGSEAEQVMKSKDGQRGREGGSFGSDLCQILTEVSLSAVVDRISDCVLVIERINPADIWHFEIMGRCLHSRG